jgi:hypothetical protein
VGRLDPTDDLAIRDLVHRYADAVVHRDVVRWSACWARAGRWDLGRVSAEGRDEIAALWRRAMGNMTAVVQLVHNGTVQATDDGDRASGRWYVDERFARTDGVVGILLAHYDDEYVRDADGEWHFASRVLQIHYTGAPDLSDSFLNTHEALTARGVAATI